MDARTWYSAGNAYAGAREYEKALSCYDHALALDSSYENAWNNRGCCCAHLGYYDEAAHCFERCGERYNLATVLGIAGRYDESLDVFFDLLARAPTHLAARISAIALLTHMGRYEEALQCSWDMPLPGGMTYMLLGSLPDEFKHLKAVDDTGKDLAKAIQDSSACCIGATTLPGYDAGQIRPQEKCPWAGRGAPPQPGKIWGENISLIHSVSSPYMYGLSTFGTSTEPSSCW
jgi:hypothetical protein